MPSQGLQQVQRLSLQQTLSPQMQQSLHILQIPAMELNALIRQELSTNPVLEESPPSEETTETVPTDFESEPLDQEFKVLAQLDQEWRDYFYQTNLPPRPASEEEEQRRRTFFESVAKPETLQEHLLAQLQVTEVTNAQRQLCETLIGNIDERGYLIVTKEEMDEWSHHLPEASENALRMIQSFDPIGVGARDLRECLLLQLQRLGHSEDSIAIRIASGYLDDLAAKHYAEIAAALGVSLSEVHRAAALISTLDPQPGSSYSIDDHYYLTPDLVVQKAEEEWVVFANDEWLPHLRISNTYKDILGQSSQNNEAKNYVRERLRTAKFFIKSIQQRQQTVLKIAQEIIRVQIDFLNHGRSYLKPLTMTEVAQWIGVHETTVSRAIANKYMQTPHGIFELKYFFAPGIRLADGGIITQHKVKVAISELVASEAPDHPLTDQEIMQVLKGKNIPLARRTVAKYREELHILPSHLRKSR